MGVGGSIDQLDGGVYTVAGAGDGAFEDAVDAEFSGDVANRTIDAFVLHRRGVGDNSQRRVLGQSRDEFVGHAVGEILLRGIAREIG